MMVQVVCYGIFLEIPSGNVPVFSAIWFDNGFMFASAHEVLLDKGVDMPVVMLDSLVQTVLGQVVDVPVVVQRQVCGLTVQNAMLVPQLPFFAGRRHSGYGAEACSRDLPCLPGAALFLVVDVPVCRSCSFFVAVCV